MLAKAPIVIYNSFKLGPALGEFGKVKIIFEITKSHSNSFFVVCVVCRVYGFVGGLTGTASIATLTAISIDRYNVGKKLNIKI